MNTQEIIENNKLIAQFRATNINFEYGYLIGREWFELKQLKFHSSYEWLMPVLQKIQNSGCIIEISYSIITTCRICYLGKNKYDKAINFYGDNNGGEEPIMAIYKCVVEFLKFLENEKENNK